METGTVTVIDYGIGNLRSIEKALESVGARVVRTDDPELILEAKRVVLPGVGAFGACMAEIERRGLVDPIRRFAASGRPFLGVCIGMQLLFEQSDEQGEHAGLALLPGRVTRFDPRAGTAGDGASAPLKVPHMGWNTVDRRPGVPLLDGLPDAPYFYFVHSYHAVASRTEDVIGTTSYGVTFPAIVAHANVMGVQFHPEKSQRSGLFILKNFSNLC